MLLGDLFSNLLVEGMKITIRGLSKNCIRKVGWRQNCTSYKKTSPLQSLTTFWNRGLDYNSCAGIQLYFFIGHIPTLLLMFWNKINLDSDFFVLRSPAQEFQDASWVSGNLLLLYFFQGVTVLFLWNPIIILCPIIWLDGIYLIEGLGKPPQPILQFFKIVKKNLPFEHLNCIFCWRTF